MSCWVVPNIAAEYLGISLDELHHRLRSGTLSSKHDHGFLFVDVAPDSPVFQMAEPKPTYMTITAEEMEALTEESEEVENEEIPDSVPITSSPDWAGARQFASQLRRRPAA